MLGTMLERAWQETYVGLLDVRILAARSARKSADRFRSDGCRNVFVGLEGETPAGFCGFGPARGAGMPASEGEIYGLYVLRAYQRRGLGGTLVRMALEELKKAGFASVHLWVLESNRRAVDFYERQGFVPDGGKTVFMLDIPVRELCFRRHLKARNAPA